MQILLSRSHHNVPSVQSFFLLQLLRRQYILPEYGQRHQTGFQAPHSFLPFPISFLHRLNSRQSAQWESSIRRLHTRRQQRRHPHFLPQRRPNTRLLPIVKTVIHTMMPNRNHKHTGAAPSAVRRFWNQCPRDNRNRYHAERQE